MKFSHYDEAWESFKKYVIMPEAEKLRSERNYYDLAEQICYEWSVIPDDIRGDMIKNAAEAYAHDSVDKNAAAIIRLSETEGKKAVQAAADCQGAENELARLWAFLRLGDPGCTLEDSNDTSTPFGALAQIADALQSAEAQGDPREIRRKIFDAMPENGAKRLPAKRWFDSAGKVNYPQKFADKERKNSSEKISPADKELLDWSIAGGDPPEKFAAVRFLEAERPVPGITLFEGTEDIQALLLFLIRNPEIYPSGVFLDYWLFALTYLADDIDLRGLLESAAEQTKAPAEFAAAVINLLTRQDAASRELLQRLAEGNDPDAVVALYAAAPDDLPGAAEALKRAAAAGSVTAAYFLVRDFGEEDAKIKQLAERSALSGDFTAEKGIRPKARFFKALREYDHKTLAEILGSLSPAEAKRLSRLWRRAAAENRFPEKLADIYALGSVIDRAAGMETDDLLYRAASLGSLEALLELYDLFAEKKYPVYQKRLREIALADHKLTPRQKVHLGLLKLVNH